MTTIHKSLQVLLKDSSWMSKLFLGGLFLYIPVINCFVIGYIVNYFDLYLKKYNNPPLPAWCDNPGSNLGRGIVVLALFLIYLAGPAIFLVIGIFLLKTKLFGSLWIIFMVFTIVITLVAYLFFPMSVANYLSENLISSAFRIGHIYDKLRHRFNEYVKIYLVTLFICILVGGNPFCVFYVLLASVREVGLLFSETSIPGSINDW